MPVQWSIDERRMRDLGQAMRRVEDGQQLRKDLIRNAREVLNPTRNKARAAIKATPSKGHAGPKITRAIAAKVMVQIKTNGTFPGAALKAKKTPNIRGFKNAPKRFNSRKGWRHPVINNPDKWVAQRGNPGWFDDTIRKDRGRYRNALRQVLHAHEKRIRTYL